LHRADVREHLRQFYPFPFATRGQQWRDGRAEMPRIDFIKCEPAIQRSMKRAGVPAATGANGFERRHANTTFMQTTCEQCCQPRFADAGIRAGDEKRGSLHSATSKRKCGQESIKTIDGIGAAHLTCAAR
jgi:hypothetical protein